MIKKLRAASKLKDAMVARRIAALEEALDSVKKGGWEKDLDKPVTDATALLEKVIKFYATESISPVTNMFVIY